MSGQAVVLRGDARRIPLADGSVDLIVTSPPYYLVRDYGVPGQLGSEPTPREYLEALWAVTHEMARVLKPSGSIWVNLGDKHCQYEGARNGHAHTFHGTRSRGEPLAGPHRAPDRWGIPRKSLLGLPEAYALGCTGMLAHLGGPDTGLRLIWRRDQIWEKTNPLPESATDRCHTTHEYWLHFVKQPRYYCAVDELRQPYKPSTIDRDRYSYREDNWGARNGPAAVTDGGDTTYDGASHPLGRMPGSVWSIPAERANLPKHLGTDHFAVFGVEWPRRLILGWSPHGVCQACGQGRVPVAPVTRIDDRRGRVRGREGDPLAKAHGPDGRSGSRYSAAVQILGYACPCCPHTDHPGTAQRSGAHGRYAEAIADGTYPENFGAGSGSHANLSARPKVGPHREYHLDRWVPPPTRPAVVLDPFGGTGTTSHVAAALGRTGITLDLSGDYCRLAADWTLAATRAAKVHTRTNAERQLDLLGGTA